MGKIKVILNPSASRTFELAMSVLETDKKQLYCIVFSSLGEKRCIHSNRQLVLTRENTLYVVQVFEIEPCLLMIFCFNCTISTLTMLIIE
jgi:hypothetical protein